MLAFPNKNIFLYTREFNNLFKTTMLEFLITYNGSVNATMIDVIDDIKF